MLYAIQNLVHFPNARHQRNMSDEPEIKSTTVSIEDWSCCLCKEILYEPITLPCGHTCCRVCIYRYFFARTYEKVCPLCRGQCIRIVPQIASVNVMISNFVRSTYAAAYDTRKIECDAIKATWPEPLFIYFSSNFILPFEVVTVVFSEMRYVSMIQKLQARADGVEKSFLLLPLAAMKRGDIGLVVVIISATIGYNNTNNNVLPGMHAVCKVRCDRRCKVMDCWLTDHIEGVHCAQTEPYEDEVSPPPPGETVVATLVSIDTSDVDQGVLTFEHRTEPMRNPDRSRSKQIATCMAKIEKCIEEANKLTHNYFTDRTVLTSPPLTDPVQMSWWIFKALAFDGPGLQARVPIFLTSSILHSRDPLWRLQIAIQLFNQLISKFKEHKTKSPIEAQLPLLDQETNELPYAESTASTIKPRGK